MYCTPILVLPSFNSVAGLKFLDMLVASSPSIHTAISFGVNVLFSKYLSVPFKVIVTWLVLLFIFMSLTCQNGSTTSTISSEPVSPGIVIPEVMFFTIFPWLEVSFTLLAGIVTVTTPL